MLVGIILSLIVVGVGINIWIKNISKSTKLSDKEKLELDRKNFVKKPTNTEKEIPKTKRTPTKIEKETDNLNSRPNISVEVSIIEMAIFLNYINHKPVLIHYDKDKIPKIILKKAFLKKDSYKLPVYDESAIIKFHKTLIENGYLEKDNVEEALSKLKTSELKDILSKNSLRLTGKKQELLNRLKDNVKNLEEFIKIDSYQISKKGKELISKYWFLDELDYYNNVVSVKEFLSMESKIKKKFPKPKFNDILWAILNKKIIKNYAQNNRLGISRISNLKRAMGDLLCDEEKYEEAYFKYLESLYIQVNYVYYITDMDTEPLIELQEYYNQEMINKCYEQNPITSNENIKIPFKELVEEIHKDKLTSSELEEKYRKHFKNFKEV